MSARPLLAARPAAYYPKVVKADNPVSYWRLNEAVNATTAVDQMGNAPGTYAATPPVYLGRTSPFGDTTGGAMGLRRNAGVTFTIPTGMTTGTAATAEAWICTNLDKVGSLINLTNHSTPWQGIGFGVFHNAVTGAKNIDVNFGTAGWLAPAEKPVLCDGQWHHVVVTRNGTSGRVYLDGVQAGSTITSSVTYVPYSAAGATGTIEAGSTAGSPAVSIAEVAVYNYELNATQVAAHYAAAKAGRTPDRAIILQASATWQQHSLQEPSVYYDGTQWVMIYSGGWSVSGLGYATCPGAADPTVAANWTDQSTAGPLIGQGAGGFTNGAARSSVLIDGATMYVYFADPGNQATTPMYVASGPNITSLTVSGTPVLSPGTFSINGFANSQVMKVGSTYHMIFEATGGAAFFRMGYATASNPLGPWTIQNYPLNGLGYGGIFGGPTLYRRPGGTWSMWYHSSQNTTQPTDLVQATSTDLVNWTKGAQRINRWLVNELDQCADPNMVVPGTPGGPPSGPVRFFWTGLNNDGSVITGTNNFGFIMTSKPGILNVTP